MHKIWQARRGPSQEKEVSSDVSARQDSNNRDYMSTRHPFIGLGNLGAHLLASSVFAGFLAASHDLDRLD